MNLLVSSQIGNNREVTSTTLHVASKRLLAGVAVHMSLEGAGSSESLVADLALVLLLSVGRELGRELTHHGLRSWGSQRRANQLRWTWKRA